MCEVMDFVNVDVRPSPDRRCLALIDGDRAVHLDGTAEFFDTLCESAAQIAGTLRDHEGDSLNAARRRVSRALSEILGNEVQIPQNGRLPWSFGGVDCRITVFGDAGAAAWLGVEARCTTTEEEATLVTKVNAINASGLNQVKVLVCGRDILVVGEIPIWSWLQTIEVNYLIQRVAGTAQKVQKRF